MVFRYANPLHPMHQLRREMDRIWSNVVGENSDPPWTGVVRGHPPVNVWETADAVYVETEIPGTKSDQLDISVLGDQVTIKVDRVDAEEGEVVYHRRERAVGSFSRVVRLPGPVNVDAVEAELQNGVLTIKLPKTEEARPRKISVVGR